MLLSQKRKFIFIHIAKTGGSSISSALMPYCKPRIQEIAHRYLSLLNIRALQPMPYDGHISAKKLPHKKYIKKKPYQYYYTPELRDTVASFSKEDIDTFGYSFEN